MSVSDVLKDRESEGNSSRVSKVKCDGAHQAVAMELLSLQRPSKLSEDRTSVWRNKAISLSFILAVLGSPQASPFTFALVLCSL